MVNLLQNGKNLNETVANRILACVGDLVIFIRDLAVTVP
jgi:hypothetical protein